MCGIFFILGVVFHYTIIVSRQQFNITPDDIRKDDNFNADIFNKFCSILFGTHEFKYRRKLFKFKEELEKKSS